MPDLCNDECVVACDFCQFYDFNGDDLGAYTGDGWCRLHERPQDPGDGCDDFRCALGLGPASTVPYGRWE